MTGIKSPQLTQATDEGAYAPANTVAYLWERLDWYVAGLAVLSIFVAAGKMAWQRNGAPFWELLQSILTMIVVSSAGVATISLLTSASDQAASYILRDALTKPGDPPSNFQTEFASMFTTPAATPATAFVLVGLLALVLIASVVQIVLLIIRGGMLFLLAGMLPLAAAATNTETGRQWFRKTIAWTIAFLLYKPVAAIVYATAFQLTREGGAAAPTAGDDIIKVITGLTMCLLALFALPALMRFTVPAVAAAAGSGGGGAGLALGGALAMGAKNALTKSGGGGARSGPPSKPPTQSEGSSGGDSGPKGSSVAPSGGQLAGQSTATQTATKKAAAAAGPAGAVATAVADGLKKVNESANSAVSQAAGEDAPASAPGRATGPGKGKGNGGKSPSSGPSSKTTIAPPAKTPPTPPAPPPPTGKGPSGSESGKPTPPSTSTPPVAGGPSGSQSGKPTPPTPPQSPPPAPSSNTEGPSGGKRK